jgi:imidazolonepropionase-like amidohydrolase
MPRWLRILLRTVVVVVVLFAAFFYLFAVYPLRVKHPPLVLAKGTLAIQHARIYTSPTDPVIPDGSILIVDGRIAAVGTDIAIPAGAELIPCDRCTVTAGFWNSHVHFTEGKWSLAEFKSTADLNPQLEDMLTSRGFTTVVDTGSNMIDTLALRRRIESGELAGPYIYTAEAGLYPPHGIPFYIKESAPKWIQMLMPEPETPEQAAKVVRRNIEYGADITKLFTGSYVERGTVLPMPVEIARAAVEESHKNGRLVFSHPSDFAGTKVARDSGVDVLAHAPDTTEGVDRAFLQSIVEHKMAMIPTLKMFGTTVTKKRSYLDPIDAEVRQFHELGGQLIFGTDVGYMHDYSTDDEFAELVKSGLSPMDILAMLTINPASRFAVLDQKGTIAAGKLADLTILDGDPGQDASLFTKVRTTIRSGRIIYQHK